MVDAPLNDLNKARERMVAERLACIEELAKPYEQGKTEQMMDLLLKFQQVIDILDKVGRVTTDEAIEQAREKLAMAYGRHPDDTSDD
jgi:cobalamin biosynthesis protein CobD/CbiB